MQKQSKIIIAALVTGIIAAYLIIDSHSLSTLQETQNQGAPGLPSGAAVGELAPEFSGHTLDGETVRLSDFKGQIAVVRMCWPRGAAPAAWKCSTWPKAMTR